MTIRAFAPPLPKSNVTPVQRAGDRYRTKIAAAITEVLTRIRSSVTLADLETAIRSGGMGAADADWSVFWQLAKDAPSYEDVYGDAVMAGAQAEALDSPYVSAFRMVNPRAVQIAQQRAAQLVVGLSANSRQAVQQVISSSLGGQYDVAESARLIRDIIGLDPRRAQAVANYRSTLQLVMDGNSPASDAYRALSDGRFSVANLTADKIDTMVSRYADRSIQDRATVIARTESMRAAHDGQRALWDEASSQGLFDESTAQRQWVVTDDDRTCELCAPMADSDPIPYNDSFEGGVDDPPLHEQCRCDVILLT